MANMPMAIKTTEWIGENDMTDKEKLDNPSYKTCGGYLKTYVPETDVQGWWDNLDEDNRQAVLDLPNFDAEIFKQITGIEV